ncbi:uncharacterized protein [Chanodichthys erythropterus]|uniref:uncharacterized protein isoform X1 n=2 Tax=Chanodichthys erythropterus TaxID=933992 RepID=UPI00351EFBAC
MKLTFSLTYFIWCSFSYGASGADKHEVSVKEGDSVSLHTGVETRQQEKIIWYINGIRIAQINGDLSKTCTDVQCNEGTERFRDRLKLDHQTGSLTIMNTTNTDAGVYELQIIRGNSRKTIFTVAVHGVFGVGPDGKSAFVMEGDSVTLHTGVQTNQQEKIIWYFNGMRIAQNTGDLSKICTDDECKKRFRDRLKLDHLTGSLTITNTRTTDSGEYKLQIISGSSEKIYNITIPDVPAAERNKMKRKSVKEGESVTFNTRVIKHPNDVMSWYFNNTLIAEITGDQSQICTDVQCDERFRDRLKLDNQTGSLTIMNTTNTDSGDYEVLITSGSISIIKTFSSFIQSVRDSGPSLAVTAGIITAVITVAVVLLVAAAVGGVIYCCRHQVRTWRIGNENPDNHGENQVEGVSLLHKNVNGTGPPPGDTHLPAANGTGPPPGDTHLPAANGTGPPPGDTQLPAANRTGPPPGDTQLPAANGTGPPPGDTHLPSANGTGPPPGDTQLPATNGTGPPPGDTHLPAANGTGPPPGDTQLPATNGTGPPSGDTHLPAANGTGPPPGDTQLPAANRTGPPPGDTQLPAANGTGPPPGDTHLPSANGTGPPPGDTQLPATNGTGPPPGDTHLPAANGTGPPPGDTHLPATNRTGLPPGDTHLPSANGTGPPPGDTQLPATNGTGPPPGDTHLPAANGTGPPPGDTHLPAANGTGPPPGDTHLPAANGTGPPPGDTPLSAANGTVPP